VKRLERPSKKILLIGGNGFLGSHLIDCLVGQLNVRVLSRSIEKFRKPNPLVEYRIGDYLDADLLESALKNIDIVVHLVSSTLPSTSNDNCILDIESNLIGSVKLLDAMRKNKCSKIIFISSGGTVYGNPFLVPTPENFELKPICSYGITKVAIENYIYMFHKLYDMDYLILRVSNLYGTRQNNVGSQGLINTFMDRIINQEEITIWGDGNATRDFIFVEDLCRLIQLAINSNVIGTFNAGSGIGNSVNEIIEIISEIVNLVPNVKKLDPRNFDVAKNILDVSKAEAILNWKATTELKKGIQLMWTEKSKILYLR
jgi:UDP-glucose 4-epimerase